MTPGGRVKKPSVTSLCHLIITAWQYISLEVLVKGRKECHISSLVGGTDDILWNFCEEDGNFHCECEKVKVLAMKTLIGKNTENLACFVC